MLQNDRLESFKAGILGAFTAAVVFSILLLINSSILAARFEVLRELRIDNSSLLELISLAIAAISGFYLVSPIATLCVAISIRI